MRKFNKMSECAISIGRRRIATAGKKYHNGKWIDLPEGYYITARGGPVPGKGVPYLADYRDVMSFGDELDVITSYGEFQCSIEELEKFAKRIGVTTMRFNLEGSAALKTFPEGKVTGSFLKNRLQHMKDKDEIEDFQCTPENYSNCVVWFKE